MEQVRLFAVWPMENWLGSSLNQMQGWSTVRESYFRALEANTSDPREWGMNGDIWKMCSPDSTLDPHKTPIPARRNAIQVEHSTPVLFFVE